MADLGVKPRYWQDEIATVIKGRRLVRFEEYADLARIGHSTPLQAGHRQAVWDLYERYEDLRREKGVLDRDDVLLLFRDLIRTKADAGDTGYDAVIVDEVQDLTCAGLQLLHAFVGDKPDGLMIVGDGQQSIYPGGFTLTEAGVSVVGRSTLLQCNYRNREQILQYALAVVANDDFDSDPQRGKREVHAERPGDIIDQVSVTDALSQEMALCAHLLDFRTEQDVRYGDVAVLAPTNAQAQRWYQVLTKQGIPVISLLDYDETPCEAVKIGTFRRVKSLDFAHVCIPDRNLFPLPQSKSESAEAYRERAARRGAAADLRRDHSGPRQPLARHPQTLGSSGYRSRRRLMTGRLIVSDICC